MKVGNLARVYIQRPVVNDITNRIEIVHRDYVAIIVHIGNKKVEIVADGNIRSVPKHMIEILA